ncbi:DNA mismatch repair protein MutS, partial [Vibrio parahaemolyticus EKP-028]
LASSKHCGCSKSAQLNP